MHLAAPCRAPSEPSLSFGVGYTTEVPLVFLFQLLSVSPASASRAGLDERPGPKLALRCGVRFRIGAVEYGAKDVQIGMRAGHTARIEVLAAMREHQASTRVLGEELPANGSHWGRIRVTEPPRVLEDSRWLPARDF